MSLVKTTTAVLGGKERKDHVLARIGYKRGDHRVEPGLYSVNSPDDTSPVLVTSNYTLSFDAVRSQLDSIKAWILVLDTKGINVWCAAGKGTFGTDEVVRQVQGTGLAEKVTHRRLILPQLGAPGVKAHEVRQRTDFIVEYGPVRAEDIPEYLKEHKATKEMRRVDFPIKDRAVLIPVELRNYLFMGIPVAIALAIVAGWFGLAVFAAGYLGGLMLFPLLLPYLPGRSFSVRGMALGLVLSVPLMAWTWAAWHMPFLELAVLDASIALSVIGVVAYLALNFTGSTPYASRTGVRNEIYSYIPSMVVMSGTGLILAIAAAVAVFAGWF